MSEPNPYSQNLDEYLQDYEGPYDPLFSQKSSKGPYLKKDRVNIQPQVRVQDQGIIKKTIDSVKGKTEDIVDDLTSKQTLTAVAQKKRLSVIDYAILLSSVYGIGAAVGITAGAAKNITPKMSKKPKLFWVMISLGAFGAYKGFQTATQYRSLRQQLEEQSDLEKKLSKYLPDKTLYR